MKKKKGSFTVEAALLFSVLIPLLVCLIYGMFYIHDRMVIQGAVCEIAARYGLILPKERAGTELSAGELLSERLLGTEQIFTENQADEHQAVLSAGGSFVIPGIAAPFMSGTFSIKQEWNRTFRDPAGTIRKIRGIGNLLKREE